MGYFMKHVKSCAWGGTLALFCLLLLSISAEVQAADFEQMVRIDGSSTVYPITEAIAEEYLNKLPSTKVTVGISGTGGGFKKFCAGEIDISDASRPIKESELSSCSANGIEFIEIPVAYDAISVVVNPKNTWARSLTVSDLKKLWEPAAQGKIKSWKDIRPDWPDRPVSLFGPGVDSGTYDYFTEAIVGKEHSSRGDFTSSEDDNVLVQGVSGDAGALGFFGMAYYMENKDKLVAVGIDDANSANGDGPQFPSAESVINGHYQPLSRPLFIYVSRKAAEREAVNKFVEYYLGNVALVLDEVGNVKLPDKVYRQVKERFERRVTGSVFRGKGSVHGLSIEGLMQLESNKM